MNLHKEAQHFGHHMRISIKPWQTINEANTKYNMSIMDMPTSVFGTIHSEEVVWEKATLDQVESLA